MWSLTQPRSRLRSYQPFRATGFSGATNVNFSDKFTVTIFRDHQNLVSILGHVQRFKQILVVDCNSTA